MDELLGDVGLEGAGGTQLRKYSKGMLQRIGIAQALVNDPKLVLLDEPMTGLDPLGRVEVKRIIEALRERGKTVLFNSHILADVARAVLAHRHHGRRPGRLAGRRPGRAGRRERRPGGLLHEGGGAVMRVLAIAGNTFRETIRDRVLAVIVLFALFMIVASLWLASISLGQQGRMMKDFGLVAVSFFGLIVAVFVAASLVHKEVEKRTVFVLFSKPVGRTQFIWRQVPGSGGHHGSPCSPAWACSCSSSTGSSPVSPSGWLLVAVALIYVQLLAVMAVTIFFSTLTSAILASVLGICVFVAGQLSHNVLSLTRLGHSAVLEASVVGRLRAGAQSERGGHQGRPWWARARPTGRRSPCGRVYLAAYMIVVLVLASLVFRRKEF